MSLCEAEMKGFFLKKRGVSLTVVLVLMLTAFENTLRRYLPVCSAVSW